MTSRSATTWRDCLTALGTCACLGCAPPATTRPGDLDQWVRAFCSVRFSAPHEITLITRQSARDSDQFRLAHIVEIGGRVVAYHGDTLVIEPFYLTTIPETGGERMTAYRTGRPDFPDFALVPLKGDVAIGDFRTPHRPRPRSPDQIVAMVLGTGMMLTLLWTDVVLLLHL